MALCYALLQEDEDSYLFHDVAVVLQEKSNTILVDTISCEFTNNICTIPKDSFQRVSASVSPNIFTSFDTNSIWVETVPDKDLKKQETPFFLPLPKKDSSREINIAGSVLVSFQSSERRIFHDGRFQVFDRGKIELTSENYDELLANNLGFLSLPNDFSAIETYEATRSVSVSGSQILEDSKFHILEGNLAIPNFALSNGTNKASNTIFHSLLDEDTPLSSSEAKESVTNSSSSSRRFFQFHFTGYSDFLNINLAIKEIGGRSQVYNRGKSMATGQRHRRRRCSVNDGRFQVFDRGKFSCSLFSF